LSLLFSTGCQTTGGKVFGVMSGATMIGGVALLANSDLPTPGEGTSDSTKQGAALLFTAVAAVAAVGPVEVFGDEERPFLPVLGRGPVAPPQEVPVVDAPVEPPAPVVVVHDRERDPYSRGWHFDPADGQQKLYDRAGVFVGRFDDAGDVWDH